MSSQMLVFSKTSLQRDRIAPRTPRALYFNDDVYIGFCRLGEVMEVSVADPKLGTVFYTLDQEPAGEAAICAADGQLPVLPPLAASGHPGERGAIGLSRPRRQPDPLRRVIPHRPHEPAQGTLGRLVRHRHARQAERTSAT